MSETIREDSTEHRPTLTGDNLGWLGTGAIAGFGLGSTLALWLCADDTTDFANDLAASAEGASTVAEFVDHGLMPEIEDDPKFAALRDRLVQLLEWEVNDEAALQDCETELRLVTETD